MPVPVSDLPVGIVIVKIGVPQVRFEGLGLAHLVAIRVFHGQKFAPVIPFNLVSQSPQHLIGVQIGPVVFSALPVFA